MTLEEALLIALLVQLIGLLLFVLFYWFSKEKKHSRSQRRQLRRELYELEGRVDKLDGGEISPIDDKIDEIESVSEGKDCPGKGPCVHEAENGSCPPECLADPTKIRRRKE